MIYNKKLVKCGELFHYYDYKNRFFKYGFKRDRFVIPNLVKSLYAGRKKQGGDKRDTHVYRSKRQVKYLLQCNSYQNGIVPVFVTFTFKDNIQDLKAANKEFNKFIKRLNYEQGYKARYLVVPEFQKRGAVHYHCVFFNLVGSRHFHILSSVWGNGFVWVENIRSLEHLCNYVVKYFTKDLYDSRLVGQKSYFCSRGLIKPVVIRSYEGVIVDSSYMTLFSKDYIIRDYSVKYELLKKWIPEK